MKKENVSQIINDIDEKYICEAAMYNSHTVSSHITKTQPVLFKLRLFAASIAFIILIGFAISAITFETHSYNNAIAYFEEAGLSSDGLSRLEVKTVYRDISIGNYANEKVIEVLLKSAID